MSKVSPVVWFVPIILLIIALLSLPYGYYTLLRIVVTLAAGFLAYKQFEKDRRASAWVVSLSVIAILFNPVIPIHLSREMWQFIDPACAVIYFVHYFSQRKCLNEEA